MELIKKTGNNSLEALGQAFRRPLIAALQAQDSQAINRELKLFKNTDGSPKMEMVLAIQRDNRITEMAAVDNTQVAAMIAVSLTSCFENMNLSRPMRPEQIIDLTDAIIESAGEDQLAIEDLLLFLQGLLRGKYGKMYESMDMPKFFEFFEQYREQRHKVFLDIKYEQEVRHKALGPSERSSDEFEGKEQSMRDELNRQFKAEMERKYSGNDGNA